jgi:hypothetical protein
MRAAQATEDVRLMFEVLARGGGQRRFLRNFDHHARAGLSVVAEQSGDAQIFFEQASRNVAAVEDTFDDLAHGAITASSSLMRRRESSSCIARRSGP